MEAIYASIAGIFIPIGFMCVVIAKEFKSTYTQNSLVIGGACVVLIGMILCFGALWLAWQREKREQDEALDRIKDTANFQEMLGAIFFELRGLRQDLKGGDKNGGSKDTSAKPKSDNC